MGGLIAQILLWQCTSTGIERASTRLRVLRKGVDKDNTTQQASRTEECWDAIPQHFQERVLHNVLCPHCGDMTTMTDFTGEVHGRSLVLQGTIVTCRGRVARVLEGASEHAALKPGDRVLWWKRIPEGNYIYPVQATVLALTAKRVKIAARDDGERVIRYVPAQSLQGHE
jgi:hypothetical protein